MPSISLLFPNPEDPRRRETRSMPDYFIDLNLDQILSAITGWLPDYGLETIFYQNLRSLDEIRYRQHIFQDLEQPELLQGFKTFSSTLRSVRRTLGSLEKLYNPWHRRGWFLESARVYQGAVESLFSMLQQIPLRSMGFVALREYLTQYRASAQFQNLANEIESLTRELSSIRYSIVIKGLTVRVKKYEGEPDYSSDIESFFSRFRQGDAKNYIVKMNEPVGLSSVETQILSGVATLFPEIFSHLNTFCDNFNVYIDETLDSVERELQFYITYLDYIRPVQNAGLPFCYPDFDTSKNLDILDLYDLVLAKKLQGPSAPVVNNDLEISGKERIVVITGPNQGGKTTFARAVGQLHHLGALGFPVPGRRARLLLADTIYTHFEREETTKSQRGRLHEELIALHNNLEHATDTSLFILNEVFSSTTLKDALYLSTRILDQILKLDALAICVTFLDELAALNDQVVSMVTSIDPVDPSIRTFKVIRRPADGLAYARSIAEKYHLTYEWIHKRFQNKQDHVSDTPQNQSLVTAATEEVRR